MAGRSAKRVPALLDTTITPPAAAVARATASSPSGCTLRWSVEQGVRFFREAAFLEEGSARREAERGTFDPGYGVYALGKLMLLKLRQDVKTQQGQRFSLKAFHDGVLGLGGLRYPLQREALLGAGEGGALLE